MKIKKIFFIIIILCLAVFAVLKACLARSAESPGESVNAQADTGLTTEAELSEEESSPEMEWLFESEIPNSEFVLNHEAAENGETGRRSMYCWNPDFENSAMFSELLPVLLKYGINRIYLDIESSSFASQQTCEMVKKFRTYGIEPVLLLGNPEWIDEGLGEYTEALNALNAYNSGIGAKYTIDAVALDVEYYAFEQWYADPEAAFDKYIEVMASACSQAKAIGLDVIQVIPVSFDEVSREKLEIFLDICCDEISIMNYKKMSTFLIYGTRFFFAGKWASRLKRFSRPSRPAKNTV